jgi:N-dimethylarginine dimethylaminohydrolase
MKFFMTEPVHFDVVYEINPWMSTANRPDAQKAMEDWQGLRRAILAYAQVDTARFDSDTTPDECFAANHAVALDSTLVLAKYRYPQRAPEELNIFNYFRKKPEGKTMVYPSTPFEGEGDCLACGDRVFAGFGFRTAKETHPLLSKIAAQGGMKLSSLHLVDDRFYHLDTCFCPIGSEAIVYYPGAFDADSRREIEGSGAQLIKASEEEAKTYLCNSVVVADKRKVITAQQPGSKLETLPSVRALSDLGYEVIGWDASEFLKSGGGAKCLALTLSR